MKSGTAGAPRAAKSRMTAGASSTTGKDHAQAGAVRKEESWGDRAGAGALGIGWESGADDETQHDLSQEQQLRSRPASGK